MFDWPNSDTNLLQEVINYWELRSDSYSQQNLAELHCFKRDAWQKLILENAPPKDRLRVLDVGTGPGFFAINLTLSGHNVTAVDMTPAMLDRAAKNAQRYGAEIRFELANAHELPFEEKAFDLVISRNVVWNLEEPEKALQEWTRVLAPGGRLLYYDANWYQYLFDEQLRIQYEKAQEEANRLYAKIHDPVPEISMKMEAIARNLPLSCEYRPQWDRVVLEENGLKIVNIQENIGELVWDEEEKTRYAATPMFMICAEL
jgi:ubiquinone/menaquinone biosynthesis C-methylase UbiE